MPIELSNETFTNEADIVPSTGQDVILNSGMANTLAGNDIITGTWNDSNYYIPSDQFLSNSIIAIYNTGTLNTADGNDKITGSLQNQYLFGSFSAAICNMEGNINTGDGNDIITGNHNENLDPGGYPPDGYGIFSYGGSIHTGNGNDIITGIGGWVGISLQTNTFTGNGNDTITGSGGVGITNGEQIHTGIGNDVITGNGFHDGLQNGSTITTSEGNDIITGTGGDVGIWNANLNTGDGNDIITGTSLAGRYGIYNWGTMDTGDGNDVITAIGGDLCGIGNEGTINTGNGADSIIAEGGFGSVEGFDPLLYNEPRIFLGNGIDYLKGYGIGAFNGGNDRDTLELTPGSYVISRSGTMVSFAKGSTIMKTSEFEELIAGSTTYDFTTLVNGQTIVVA
jgi:Ca2+-binding RTX toxin-like protein